MSTQRPIYASQQSTTMDLSDTCTQASTPVESLHSISKTETSALDSSSTLGAHTTPTLSTTRLLIAHFGACLTLFMATTDATIVSTSLPTIARDLSASRTEYTWIGVAYLLTQTAFQPLYGRISRLVGQKVVLYTSMFTFLLGSILCGSAQTITWLILARALAGMGGGGIVSAVWTILSEIVEVDRRAKWSLCLSITWACSAVAGPLLGGLFSSSSGVLNWRGAFYMNLPLCLIGFLTTFFSLRHVQLKSSADSTWHKFFTRFDFVGLAIFMTGTTAVIVGFSFAGENGWDTPFTLTFIVGGPVVLILGGIYEVKTSREAIFPLAVFQNMTVVIVLAISFLHNFSFCAGTFYLVLFFQAVKGYSPILAGLALLPYSLGSSLASMPVAWFINRSVRKDTHAAKSVVSVGLLISVIGFGLLNILSENSPAYASFLFPLISGIGIGMLFHTPYQILAKFFSSDELAASTSAFFLVRFTGATVGLAVAGAVFDARTEARLPPSLYPTGESIDFTRIIYLQPSSLRQQVLHVVASSIQTIWTVATPCLGFAFIISFAIRDMQDDERKSERVDSSNTRTVAPV